MNKEDILKASREENKNKDYADIESSLKAYRVAGIGIVLLATYFYNLEILVKGVTNNGWYSIIATFCAIAFGVKSIGTTQKKRYFILLSVIWAVVAIMLIVTYTQEIIAASTML